MKDKRGGRELMKWIAVIATTLLAFYVGAYFALVEPFALRYHSSGEIAGYIATYPRIHGSFLTANPAAMERSLSRCERFFGPIHWIDLRIRPHVWEPPAD